VQKVSAATLLYGSDAPRMCFTQQIGWVLLAPIQDDEKWCMLGRKLARLLTTRR
jgi:hypothetical protein